MTTNMHTHVHRFYTRTYTQVPAHSPLREAGQAGGGQVGGEGPQACGLLPHPCPAGRQTLREARQSRHALSPGVAWAWTRGPAHIH
jgi:hypothetical protein